jgi:magnesium transporter
MSDNQPLISENRTFETAEEHALRRVPTASHSSSVGEIRRHLAENTYDSLTHVAILQGAELVGVLAIEDLFSAPEEAVVSEIMDPDPPVVAPDADQEVAAWRAVKHEESALAVVDKEGNFVGFIPRTGFWPFCSGNTRRIWTVWVDF